ncbi:uncharacterized protein LAESUDRAFT_617459, partial [Laetiporus sulphureus 93-53]
YRKVGWKPTETDYQEYLTHRRRLLENEPRMRAAAAAGGILWRLTFDFFDSRPLSLSNPSASIGSGPPVIDENCKFYDDFLMQEDLYTLCGVY